MSVRSYIFSLAVMAACVAASPASATVFVNAATASISAFGSPDTTTYGQVFQAPGGTLSSFSFFDSTSRADGAKFVVAAWNGTRAVGPELFTSLTGTVAASGSFFEHAYSGINLGLTTGSSYVAYLTVAGVESPVSQVSFSASNTSPLGGNFSYLNSIGVDPLATSDNWANVGGLHAQYVARFDDAVAAVPEPATWSMMLLGFGAVGYSMRRKQRVSTHVRFA